MLTIDDWSFSYAQETRSLVIIKMPSGIKTHRLIQGGPLSLAEAQQLATDTIRAMSHDPDGYQLPREVRNRI